MAKGDVKETDENGEPICGRYVPYGDGKHCENPPGYKTDHEGEGACYSCGGKRDMEGNMHGFKHGAHVSNSKYFDHLPEEQKLYVVDIYRSYMEDAPFDYSDIGKSGEIWLTAIDRHKKLRLNDYIDEQGLVITEDKIAPDGTPISEKKEHPAVLAYHRIDNRTTKKLKNYGILNDEGKRISSGPASVEVTIAGVESADVETSDEASD